MPNPDNVTLEDLSEKLCNITSSASNMISATKIFLEHLDLPTFVHLALTFDFILDESGLTRDEANDIYESLQRSQTVVDHFWPNIEEFLNITTPIFLESNDSFVEPFGELMCGDSKAFQLEWGSAWDGLSENMLNVDSSSGKKEENVNACQRLQSKLESQGWPGRLFWAGLAPFLQGQILYTPDDTFTNSIIQKANKSAPDMAFFMQHASVIMNLASIGELMIGMEENLIESQVKYFMKTKRK